VVEYKAVVEGPGAVVECKAKQWQKALVGAEKVQN